jgi:hypothetical protein
MQGAGPGTADLSVGAGRNGLPEVGEERGRAVGAPFRFGAADAPVRALSRAYRTRRLIILPTLNEEEGLLRTLEELGSIPFGSREKRPVVLVVDGRSTDRTPQVARRFGAEVITQTGRGKGNAMRDGFRWARGHGFASVAVLDADGTYPCDALPALFTLLDLDWDVVIGVRRPQKSRPGSLRDFVHRFGNGVLNYCAAQFSRSPLLDVCSGFWGFRTSLVDELEPESDGFEIEAELFVKAFRLRLRVAQFPIEYRDRVGEAKLHAVRDGATILLAILRHALRPDALRPRPPKVVPPTRSGVAQGPDPALTSLVFALDPSRVVFLSAPDRRAEAEAIAACISQARPRAEVVTATVPAPALDLADGLVVAGGETKSPGRTSPVIVSLPSGDWLPEARSSILVGAPRTRRVILLRPTPASSTRRRFEVSGGYRSESSPLGFLNAWFILSAALDGSWARRELVLLTSNADRRRLEVFRRSPDLRRTASAGWARLRSWVAPPSD